MDLRPGRYLKADARSAVSIDRNSAFLCNVCLCGPNIGDVQAKIPVAAASKLSVLSVKRHIGRSVGAVSADRTAGSRQYQSHIVDTDGPISITGKRAVAGGVDPPSRHIALPDVADNCSRREAEDKLRILGFKLGATEYVTGDAEWVYGIKVHGKNVPAGTKVSVDTPITLVVGAGGMEDEYNGNDSLDFVLNSPGEDEIVEGGEGGDPTQAEPTPTDESLEEELF